MPKLSSPLLYIAVLTSLSLQLPTVQAQSTVALQTTASAAQSSESVKKAANAAISAKDWSLAVKLLDSYIAKNSDDSDVYRFRGSALIQLKRFDEAIDSYTKAIKLDPENGDLWNGLCWTQILANRIAQSRENCQKAIGLSLSNDSAIFNLGHTYLLAGDAKTADMWYSESQQLINSEDELKEKLDDFDIFIQNGWQVNASRRAKSLFHKKSTVWLARLIPVNKLLDDANIEDKKENYLKSIELREKRLPLLIKLYGKDHPRVDAAINALGGTLNQYAMQLDKQGQLYKAEPIYLRALAIAEKAEGFETPTTATYLNNLGALYRNMLNYAKAEELFQRVIVIFEKVYGTEHANTGVSLNNLATLYSDMGQYAKAEPMLLRALTIAEKTLGQDDEEIGKSLNNLAVLYKSINQYDKAEEIFLRALTIFDKSGKSESSNTGTCLNNLAELYLTTSKYSKAEPILLRALAISQKTNGDEHPNTNISLNNLAILYQTMGLESKAESMLLRALTNTEKAFGVGHPQTIIYLGNLAAQYRRLDQSAKAESLYLQALTVSEKVFGIEHHESGQIMGNLGVFYESIGQYAKAETMELRALTISEKTFGLEHPNTGRSLNNLAGLYRTMGQDSKAESLLLRAWQIANAADKPELSWNVQTNLLALYTQSQPNLAIWYGKQAINTLQTVRASNTALDKETQKSFLEKNEYSYKSLADLLFAQGRLMEGQQVLAMLKEAEYFDFLQRNSATDPRQTQANFTEQERPWSERYGKISSQLASIGKERELLLKKSKDASAGNLSAEDQARKDKLDADMAVARQAYAAFMVELKQEFSKSASAERQQEFGEKNLSSLRALQGTLRDLGHGAVTLHYLMTDKRLWILLTTPTIQLKRESTISEAELNKLIGQYREAIANRSPNIKTLGKALYDILLGPVAEDLKQADAKTLMLSLDGSLRYLPMAALYDGEQYLAKRYSLALYTSAAKDKLKDKPQANWTLAGYGLTQKHEGFNALPAVKGELDGIMEGMKGQVKFDNDFTAKAFKTGLESEPSVVHLASHFVFAPGNETDSFLLLGDGKKLSLKEIKDGYEFINLDLLTLSACETAVGGGKDANGREVEGFGALAQNQGAKGVIATLWPVADQSTGQFMQLMYGYRQQNPGMTKAQAMQKAQLAFIDGKVGPALAQVSRAAKPTGQGQDRGQGGAEAVKTTDHPFYWAPFILMGNWL